MILDNINSLLARIASLENPAACSKFENIDTYDDFKSLLQTNFSSAFNKYLNRQDIWRGMSAYSEMLIITPGIRKSQNTSNIYTRLISDILPNWKDYPKRDRSFICSTTYYGARGYGEKQYLVFPENGAKIGICPRHDIWGSFKDSIGILPNLNHAIDTLILLADDKFGSTNYDSDIFNNIDNTEELISLFNLVDMYISTTPYNRLFKKIENLRSRDFILECKENDIPLLKQLEMKLDPKTNGFELQTIENYSIASTGMDRTKEVWTDARCLFVYESKLHELIEINYKV